MATTKKKAPAKKATASAAVKKTPAKKAVSKASTKKKATKSEAIRSFRVTTEPESFTNFQITRQTIYWIILVSFIIFAQLWILKLQIEVATLIETQQAQLREL